MSEELFRAAFEQSPMSTQIFSPDGTAVWVNRAWEKLWGVTLAQLGVYNILEDRQLVEKGIMPYIRKAFTGEPTEIPDILYDPEETVPNLTTNEEPGRWVRAFTFPVKDESGKIREIVLMHEDITARKRAEETAERWVNIFQHVHWGVAVGSADGQTLVMINPAYARMHGYTVEELISRPVIDVFAPEAREALVEQIRLTRERGHHIFESLHIRKDGSVFPVLVEITAIKDANRQVLYLAAHVADITERRLIEEELRRSEENYRSLLENAHDIIYTHDLQGNYLTINRAGEEVTGYTRQEILGGLNIAQVVAPEHLELAKGMTRRKLTDPSPTVYEVDIITRDNRRLTLELSTRISYQCDQPVTVEGIARDVTERKRVEREREELLEREQQARREIEETSRLKDEFLATVSHELRTPLTAMLGWTYLLRTGKLDSEKAARALETIERNARSQAQLIEDLLDVSRVITGKLRLDMRAVEPAKIIDESMESVRPAAEAKGVRLIKTLATGVGAISGDAARLQQVVWNLLSNAIKFTPRGGSVEVGIERADSHVQIIVSDTGEGISQDFLPYVFDRFRQADAKTTRKHGGLGLGLAIVRSLVEMHGGTVHIESPGVGQGATFTVMLPLRPVYRRVTAEEQPAHAITSDGLIPLDFPERLDGLKILAVDDEADTRELLRTVLEQSGAEVITAVSAAEALELLKHKRPDVLISDVGMPEEDGYELIRKVRSLRAEDGGKTPAIALTAYARAEERLRALRSGYQMHMPKPVELAELVAVVASLVERNKIAE
ncbi:MAG: PAS domain S-box protein [Acidobacteria bacterium]|nr:PAS domain S-box protein [Acidobacteriota bacterium]